jgi:hypothetical protein
MKKPLKPAPKETRDPGRVRIGEGNIKPETAKPSSNTAKKK